MLKRTGNGHSTTCKTYYSLQRKAAVAAGNYLLEAAMMQRKCSLKQRPPMMCRHTNTSLKSFFWSKHSLMIVEHNKHSAPKQKLECTQASLPTFLSFNTCLWCAMQILHANVHSLIYFSFQGEWALRRDPNSSAQLWYNVELDWLKWNWSFVWLS